MRVAFVLPGLHCVHRGAEIAFQSLATRLASGDDAIDVTLFGTGAPRPDAPYHFVPTRSAPRERLEWLPKIPPLRSEFIYEELTWMPGLLRAYDPTAFDITVTCSYPFVNWLLRGRKRRHRPAHVFVTENGDWPAFCQKQEYRWFGCDGLVCTNPDYYERNRLRWFSALIPNGVDVDRFTPGPGRRAEFGLPDDAPIVLMASALNPNKRVDVGIRAVARVPDAWLVVAGDGAERQTIDRLAEEHLPERFKRLTVPSDQMPELYRSADVLLHLTKFESFGNVYVEGMSTGLPVVAHDSTVARWIVGHHGLLVDSENEDALVEQLCAALDRSWTPPVDLHELTSARFDWRCVAADYRMFFEQVRQRKAGAG